MEGHEGRPHGSSPLIRTSRVPTLTMPFVVVKYHQAWKVLNTITSRFNTASVTKLFTSVATLQLIERGALTFDTPVVDFLQLKG